MQIWQTKGTSNWQTKARRLRMLFTALILAVAATVPGDLRATTLHYRTSRTTRHVATKQLDKKSKTSRGRRRENRFLCMHLF